MKQPLLLLFCMCLQMPRPSFSNKESSDLLLNSLKTHTRSACDGDTVTLDCPGDTKISIQVAKYAKPEEHCRGSNEDKHRCYWPTNLQYTLLKEVADVCQKKPSCIFSTKLNDDIVDPCPQSRKYVEVAFKCRPHNFQSKTVCNGESISIECGSGDRIYIHDAKYGRVMYETSKCGSSAGVVNDSCISQQSTHRALQLCHGRQSCLLTASSVVFGVPCKTGVTPQLTVVYACVPFGVLNDRYEVEQNKAINLYSAIEENVSVTENEPETSDLASHHRSIILSKESVKPNNEKNESKDPVNLLYLYAGVTTVVFLLIAAFFFITRHFINKSFRGTIKPDLYCTQSHNVFNDTLSDLDNDVEISHISGTFYEHPDMILYRDTPGKGGMRAMRPVTTIYPCSVNMYENRDIIEQVDSRLLFRTKEDGDAMVSPRSLSRYSAPDFL